jgi:hypothetical protein
MAETGPINVLEEIPKSARGLRQLQEIHLSDDRNIRHE